MNNKEILYYHLRYDLGNHIFLFSNEKDFNAFFDKYQPTWYHEWGCFYDTVENMLNFLNGQLDKIEYIEKWKSR